MAHKKKKEKVFTVVYALLGVWLFRAFCSSFARSTLSDGINAKNLMLLLLGLRKNCVHFADFYGSYNFNRCIILYGG